MEALTSLNPKPPETMSSAGIGSPSTISPPSSTSRSTAWPTAGSSLPRLCSSNPSRTSHRTPTIRDNYRVAEMSAVINSVTKAADRDDMICNDAISHLNSSSPGCRGSKESWNRGARLNTYRRTVLPRSVSGRQFRSKKEVLHCLETGMLKKNVGSDKMVT
ncbi:uncharacterized protein LOC112202318 [Rosa chinensis]|uniref:uncharacterized protein LOC112202318 n=1 Tax=Rosa chinensis TaxID=74649 RepID=UPI000D0865F0|nr:uncharacterized protein LOC112202318 [Rosa chinensis]